ncbi:TetR/AcrR family transcriptional regulator [Chromobacterium sphagni]|uniref:HTH tetR-type domain-containing protein n=1 Tax=Chromobacterium sphagni TaxID=1903179 RepID=A0A1S1X6F2_9NEIS|nr:TetR/AcrR family transcriptional regulator [Chromobacterium sphagni]OHX15064.1 hypothetical protein BI347_14665 [Chromobacterium sphagni]OHX20738.1 hypothetical protein BI344_14490 [Chromobacterium sphagni]
MSIRKQVSQPDNAAARPRGRPAAPEQEMKQQVLEAAAQLLLDKGYHAATMEAVAKQAKVAKKTVYRFAANSEELLAAIIDNWTEAFAAALQAPAADPDNLQQTLEILLATIAGRVLSQQAVGMFRLLINDFPGREQALAAYTEHGIRHSTALLADWLERQRRRGRLRFDDTETTAGLLLAMTIAEPLRQMALGLAPPGMDDKTRARIQAAVKLCYAGMKPDGRQD